MGFALPSDYRDFIDLYGEGQINQELSVFFPGYQTGIRPSMTSLLDRNRFLKRIGFFEEFGPGPRHQVTAGMEHAELLMWGKTWNGDMLFWQRIGDNPDSWPIAMHLHHLDQADRWRRFDGGMAEFLTTLAHGASSSYGSLTEAALLIGTNRSRPRWTRLRDWVHDYGKPPSAVFDDRIRFDAAQHPNGRRARSSSPIPLRNYGRSGGDQAHFGSTGERRPLIELDDTDTAIQLHGGSQAPGMAYFLYARVDFVPDCDPQALRLELLRGGDPIATATFEPAEPHRLRLETETLVTTGTAPASVQLRIVAAPNAADIIVDNVYLCVKGTLAAAPVQNPI
ncbi:hypothetical protein GCM10027262_77530 [Nocardia tengchongensis]